MEPLSTAVSIVTAFKDVYSTATFIQKTVHTLKSFRTEQSSLKIQFDYQILRLSEFSQILGGANGEEPDMKFLKTVRTDYLQIAQKQLTELQKILAEYTRLAATQSEENKEHSIDVSKPSALVEYSGSHEAGSKQTEPMSRNGRVSPEDTGKGWSFFNFNFGTMKAKEGHTVQKRLSLKRLPEGFQWLFTKEKLRETLKEFKEWNDDLEGLLGLLLRGFGITQDEKLQDHLQLRHGQRDNIFAEHFTLSNLSEEPRNNNGLSNKFHVAPIPWRNAETLLLKARVVVEYKKSGFSSTEGSVEKKSIIVRETYAPQLAQLLKTAGNHTFRTLRLNAYSWDRSQVRCAFLFDYPEEAGEKQPQTLCDLIQNLHDEPSFKLDLKQRFFVARAVARSIGAFHSDNWLHKSIRAQAIKFFCNKEDGKFNFTSPYLTDFEISRPVAAGTRLLPHAVDVDYDVYRHPQRYGPPTTSFTKIHDIYSLGVVLLEIGLWQTAREFHDDIIEDKFHGVRPAEGIPGKIIQETFLQEAKTRLAHRMGSSYQEAVVTCLNGDLEDHLLSEDFPSEFQKRVVAKVDMKALTP